MDENKFILTLALRGLYSELVEIEKLAKELQGIKYQAEIKKMDLKEIERLGLDLHSIQESLATTKEFFDLNKNQHQDKHN